MGGEGGLNQRSATVNYHVIKESKNVKFYINCYENGHKDQINSINEIEKNTGGWHVKEQRR